MGVYSNNRTSLGRTSVVANEAYATGADAMTILIENAKNDMAMFNGIIGHDFTNAYNESAGLEIVQEGAKEIKKKIVEFLNKIWTKIKGIFETFIKKINSIIIRDNKEFLKKYKKEIDSKDYKNFKVKMRKETDFDQIQAMDDGMATTSAVIKKICDAKDIATINDLEGEIDELPMTVLSNIVGGDVVNSISEFKTAFINKCFDTEKEVLVSSADVKDAIDNLVKSDAIVQEAKDSYTMIDASIKAELTGAKNDTVDVSSSDLLSLIAATEYKVLQIKYDTMVIAYQAVIDVAKMRIKEFRKLANKALMYKAIKEDACLAQDIDDAVEAEVDSSLDSYEATGSVAGNELDDELEKRAAEADVDDLI